MPFKWTCPYCNLTQTVVDQQVITDIASLMIKQQAEGAIVMRTTAVGCSNPECLKTTVDVMIANGGYAERGGIRVNPGAQAILQQRLMPQGTAKPQPDYIPRAIRDDYYEACLIRDLSPKASATLIRRCLQGMIRDFAGIVRPRLIDEINDLRAALNAGTAPPGVTPETVDAIDHIRGIGNIGAHMEKDIDLIVPVDPEEAQLLIELVEGLFEEWYVARHRRASRFSRLGEVASQKKALIAAGKQAAALPAPDDILPTDAKEA